MLSRRDLLKGFATLSAGLPALSGEAWGARSRQVSGLGKQPQVMVGGRRVKTVDMHAHCFVPDVLEIIKDTNLAPGVQAFLDPSNPMHVTVGPERLQKMDQERIDMQVLSINPFWYSAERDLASRIIDLQNAKLAEMCALYPGRFAALASVALQYPDLAAQQLEDGIKLMGMHGCAIGGSVAGEELSAPKFDVFWAKAEELQSLIFIHPQPVPTIQSRAAGNGVLNNVIGNPLETTIALSHLIFEGTFDRFPELKICAAHGGGYLPSYSERMDHGCLVFPEQCKGKTIKKKPSEYLKQLYFDSLVFTPEALRHLVAVCGASQIVVGTDYPYPWTDSPVDHVFATPGLSDTDRAAILGLTAAKLLKIAS